MSSLKDRSNSPRREEPPFTRSVNIYIAIAFWVALSTIPIGAALALYYGNGWLILFGMLGFAVLLS